MEYPNIGAINKGILIMKIEFINFAMTVAYELLSYMLENMEPSDDELFETDCWLAEEGILTEIRDDSKLFAFA